MMQLAMGDKLVTLDDLKAVYDSMDGGGDCGVYIVHAGDNGLDKTAGEIMEAAQNKMVMIPLSLETDDGYLIESWYLNSVYYSQATGYIFEFINTNYSDGEAHPHRMRFFATNSASYPNYEQTV